MRTLGLITYPLYLTHNIIGTAIIRVLIDAGLDATLAVWVALGMLVLVCWFICAKIEPAIRAAMTQAIAYFGQLPERLPASRRSAFSRGLGLRLPVPAKMTATLPARLACLNLLRLSRSCRCTLDHICDSSTIRWEKFRE